MGGEGDLLRRNAGEDQTTTSEAALFPQVQGVPILQALVAAQPIALKAPASLHNLCLQKLIWALKN